MSSEVARPEGSAFELFKSATTEQEKYEAGRYAVEARPVPGFAYPVPPFFFDLPWVDDSEDIITGLLAQLAGAEDLEAATADREPVDPADIVGKRVTVLGVAARKSDVKDARWGAYLTLTVSIDGGAPEIINTGAGEVCVLMWRLFCEGKLPASGSFVLRGTQKEGRKQPVGFRLESEL